MEARLGIAVKRSRYGVSADEYREGCARAASLCRELGIPLLVIDSEFREHYPAKEELVELVAAAQDVTVAQTVAARHAEAWEFVSAYASALSEYPNFALNLVAGNKLYLSPDEQSKSAREALRQLVSQTRALFSGEVFVGAEGLCELAAELASQHGLIPFLLYDKLFPQEVEICRRAGCESIAVYVPFYVAEEGVDLDLFILQKLGGYLLRRKWVAQKLLDEGIDVEVVRRAVERGEVEKSSLGHAWDVLLECSDYLCACGSLEEVAEKLESVASEGANVVVGYALEETKQQLQLFAKAARES